MNAPARHRHSYAEYLELDELSNVKLEFLDGQIFAMAGGTPDHAALAMNVGIALASVRERGCRVFSSDLRVKVPRTGLAAYPDLSVVCGPLEADPDSRTTVTNPALIVEVLSDSTQDYDRGEKGEHYRELASLQAYLLVSHRRRELELWRREGGAWVSSVHGAGERVELPIGVSVAVDEIYQGTGVAEPA